MLSKIYVLSMKYMCMTYTYCDDSLCSRLPGYGGQLTHWENRTCVRNMHHKHLKRDIANDRKPYDRILRHTCLVLAQCKGVPPYFASLVWTHCLSNIKIVLMQSLLLYLAAQCIG